MVKKYLGDNYNPKSIGQPKMVLDDTVYNLLFQKMWNMALDSILSQIIHRCHSNDPVLENLTPGLKISYR